MTALPEHASDMDQQPPPWACHDALAFGWWQGWLWGGVDAYGGASGANPETRDGDSKAGRPSMEPTYRWSISPYEDAIPGARLVLWGGAQQ